VRQFAVRTINIGELFEHRQDRFDLGRQQAVDRVSARRLVLQLAQEGTVPPSLETTDRQFQIVARIDDVPTTIHRPDNQVQQGLLGGRVESSWNGAT
jgi:hypothetical protein